MNCPHEVHYAKGLCRKCYRLARRQSGLEKGNNAWYRQYYHQNKAIASGRTRKHVLKKLYGITPEIYNQMLSRQKGLCAICGCPPGKYRLGVDHNHTTGKVRKLLCGPCNSRLHVLEDWPFRDIAVNYLDSHKG